MISPKLIFQCSSASLLAAAVVTAPMWVPSTLSQSETEVIGARDTTQHQTPTIQVEPIRDRHTLRSADSEAKPPRTRTRLQRTDDRSIEDRNQAAQQVLGELENTLEFRDSPQHHEAVRLREVLDHRSYRYSLKVDANGETRCVRRLVPENRKSDNRK